MVEKMNEYVFIYGIIWINFENNNLNNVKWKKLNLEDYDGMMVFL